MDFSILKRMETLIAVVAVGLASSVGTVVVMQPAEADVRAEAAERELCSEAVAALQALRAEQESAIADFERWKVRTRRDLPDTAIGKDEARR